MTTETPLSYSPDNESCSGCGLCVQICPHQVLELYENRPRIIASAEAACLRCGHCVMICANRGARLSAFSKEDFPLLEMPGFSDIQFEQFLRSRRSVRRFKDKPLPRELIERIVQLTAQAPMGFPPHTTEILIFDSKEKVTRLVPYMDKAYAALDKLVGNPITRLMVRQQIGRPMMQSLRKDVLPSARRARLHLAKHQEDLYLFHAPALLLFHADRYATSYLENAWIALTYAMLAAHAVGLGTTISGLLPPVVDRSDELRATLGIPKTNEVLAALVLGYPKYRFQRGMFRPLKSVNYV